MAIETAKDRRAREAIEALTQQLAEVRAEREALAAHVERLAGAANCYEESVDGGHAPAGDAIDDLRSAIEEKPPASLTRRDAEQQARALDEAADHATPAMHKMAEWLRCRARRIRKHGTEAGV